ncbi:Phytanoyl-CoA dioxygenase (PhyH) [Jatrophihabitans endophyticus]|uniref:Phytanoyl-CoA dioxygenase (PhyH) n=1 Tax=Jatrophihabitans endophyticus TaxID=1206085 RepID=A0A1M5RPK3_9ACTN|nr:phytanoyl-CoA dioxygenase family protein [Jatrophihabitans endophyticus]SHH28080.1 Phytanoyl-CoA dioxygenase (PhyH) [Jatrophihabitans endophyticus]
MPAPTAPATTDVAGDATEDVATLLRDGIVGARGALPVALVDGLRDDVEAAFADARSRPGGTIGRGPKRWYSELHPEALGGFAELAGHPWVQAISDAVLGPDWTIVEIGYDIPFEGAQNQPWHRDFRAPEATVRDRRLTSLAFNVTLVDTEADMGPFEIALGTQYDDGADFDHEMFPPKENAPRYLERAVRKYPSRGDISARSALTLHRGTANHSTKSRPVLVLGIDGPEADNAAHHDLAVTRDYYAALPEHVRRHLACPIVDELQPIVQKHDIEGLVMGETED